MASQVERKKDRRIRLTYLQSVQLTEGARPSEDFYSVGSEATREELATLDFKLPRNRERMDDVLATKFPSTDANIKGQEDSGWQLVNQYNEVDWTKVAYRIGIREIGINSFIFADASYKVSVPIVSPKPIWKVVLRTVEQIPAGYNLSTAWMVYHVTFDDGKTWHRINPLDKPVRFNDDGTIVPRTVTVNAETPPTDPETKDVKLPEAPRTCRLKYTLLADKNVDNSNSTSPVLKSVRLLVYTRGGLSGSQPEQSAGNAPS